MKSRLIKIISFLIVLVVVLGVGLYVNTLMSFKDSQLVVDSPLPEAPIDRESAVARFAKSIQFKTVSYDDPSRLNAEAFWGYTSTFKTVFP